MSPMYRCRGRKTCVSCGLVQKVSFPPIRLRTAKCERSLRLLYDDGLLDDVLAALTKAIGRGFATWCWVPKCLNDSQPMPSLRVSSVM